MHDNPRATEDEQELAHERQDEEEKMRGGEFHDPDAEREKARRERED